MHMVQMSRIFQDSKTFVDMKLKFSPEKVENHFRELIVANHTPSKSQIQKFVEANFSMENQMEDHVPEDWIPDPKVGSIDPQIFRSSNHQILRGRLDDMIFM